MLDRASFARRVLTVQFDASGMSDDELREVIRIEFTSAIDGSVSKLHLCDVGVVWDRFNASFSDADQVLVVLNYYSRFWHSARIMSIVSMRRPVCRIKLPRRIVTLRAFLGCVARFSTVIYDPPDEDAFATYLETCARIFGMLLGNRTVAFHAKYLCVTQVVIPPQGDCEGLVLKDKIAYTSDGLFALLMLLGVSDPGELDAFRVSVSGGV